MWPRHRLIAWWLFSAAVVASCTAWAALRWHVRSDHESHPEAKSAIPSLCQWLSARDDVNPAQSAALAELDAAYQKAQAVRHDAIRAVEAELAALMRTGGAQSPAVSSALERLSTARAELQQAGVTHFFAVQKILTPSQREALAQWTDARVLHP